MQLYKLIQFNVEICVCFDILLYVDLSYFEV